MNPPAYQFTTKPFVRRKVVHVQTVNVPGEPPDSCVELHLECSHKMRRYKRRSTTPFTVVDCYHCKNRKPIQAEPPEAMETEDAFKVILDALTDPEPERPNG